MLSLVKRSLSLLPQALISGALIMIPFSSAAHALEDILSDVLPGIVKSHSVYEVIQDEPQVKVRERTLKSEVLDHLARVYLM